MSNTFGIWLRWVAVPPAFLLGLLGPALLMIAVSALANISGLAEWIETGLESVVGTFGGVYLATRVAPRGRFPVACTTSAIIVTLIVGDLAFRFWLLAQHPQPEAVGPILVVGQPTTGDLARVIFGAVLALCTVGFVLWRTRVRTVAGKDAVS